MYLRSQSRFIALIIVLIFGIGQSASSAAIPHTVTSARTWTELLPLMASEAYRLFGWSVALDGNTMVVGVPEADVNGNTSQGAVHVYRWNGTSWGETKLTASDLGAYSRFGWSVALDDDMLVVGARGATINDITDQGAVYVYRWNGTSWLETKLTASDGAIYDYFGESVALEGNTLVVGAHLADINGNSNQGAAYVYRWNDTSWVETKLTASDGATEDLFGRSVAVNGDTVVVGGREADINGNSNQGAVYVYRWNGTSWVETKLTASDGAAGDVFGSSLALSGDMLVVGALAADINGNNAQGAAYVYRWNGSSWVETKLTASDGTTEDLFGSSLALSGDNLVVGASNADINGNIAQGAVYVYAWDGTNWLETKLISTDGTPIDRFGFSVAIDGLNVMVGSPWADVNENADAGVVYLFSGNQAPLVVLDAQTVTTLAPVTLTGTVSDPDNDPLSYHWQQTAGLSVTLTNPLSLTTDFTAPDDPTTLVFELQVTDAYSATTTGTVTITVENQAPLADAGPDQTVATLASVTLSGTASDPDHDALSFNWIQTAGTPVTLTSPLSITTDFTAPDDPTTLVFELQVTDAYSATSTGTVTVTVENQAPLADAGSDQTVDAFEAVILSASMSSDPDNDALSYAWVQVSGVPVTLTNPLSPTATFNAPSTAGSLVFELRVTDAFAAVSTDTVEVMVRGDKVFLPFLTKGVSAYQRIQR